MSAVATQTPHQLWETVQVHLASSGARIRYLGPGWAMTDPRKPKLEKRLAEIFNDLPQDLTEAGLHRCECGAASNFAHAIGCLHCDRGNLNMSSKLAKLLAFYALRCWRVQGAVRVMTQPHPATGRREELVWLSLGESEEMTDIRRRLEFHFGDEIYFNVYQWEF